MIISWLYFEFNVFIIFERKYFPKSSKFKVILYYLKSIFIILFEFKKIIIQITNITK